MTIIGIDYSINSVGITILVGDTIFFKSVISTNELSKMKVFKFSSLTQIRQDALLSLDGYTLVNRQPNRFDKKAKNKQKEMVRWRLSTLNDSEIVANHVLDAISSHLTPDTKICLENYKVGSDGDQTIQIIEFTKEFLSRLISSGFDKNNLYWVTAPEVKMFAGKGNFTKKQMLDSFLLTSPDTKMKRLIEKKYTEIAISDKNVLKPIEDIIDSYFVAKLFQKNLCSGLYE